MGVATGFVGTAAVAALAVALAAATALSLLLWRSRRRGELYAEAFAAIPQPRQVVDGRGRVLCANPAYEATFPEPLRPMPEALAERLADDEETCEQLRRLAANAGNGVPGRAEVRLRPPAGAAGQPRPTGGDGDEVWLHVAAQPMPGAGGRVLWRAEDITPRRQLQEVVEAEQARFVDLLEHAPIGFYSVDEAGRFQFVNRTLAGWLGLAPEALTRGELRLHDVVAPRPPAQVPAHSPFPAAADPEGRTGGTCTRQHGEVTFESPEGRGFRADVSQETVVAEGGTVSTRSVVRNLSEERAVADALEHTQRRFRRFFEEAPIGIALLHANGGIDECNASFCALARDRREELVGRPLSELLAADDRDTVRSALDQVAAGDGGGPLEVHLGGEGEAVCTMFLTRLEDTAGGPGGFIAHFIDTTEQKNLEVQFAQSQKMQAVGQLAGGIAHDFNNLLTAMIGFCDLLLLRHRPGDQSFADLMQIKQNANRAANLVRQLLAFSRQQTLRPRVLSITDVLAELMHLLRRLIGENIELEIHHGRDLGPVKVDQGQLEQVIINLAVNARDAMDDSGGKLTIRTSNVVLERPLKREGEVVPPGAYVLIELSDTGCGIPRENQSRVFEPFFSTKQASAGTGLGLSTVYGIVKQTGGFVLLDSKPGRGTTFSIYLPQHREEVAEGAAEAEAGAGRDLTGIGTLLLVEDEDAVRSFSARALRNKGYNVLEAPSGQAALELLNEAEEPVDLLITDVVMPQLDGPSLVRRVREQRPDLKVIFISGYTEDGVRGSLDSEAGVRFLAKPYSLKDLAGMVKQALHEAGA